MIPASRHVLVGAFVAASALSSVARADSAPAATCTLNVVNALPGEGGIDPQITALRPFLQKPPFNSWKTFKLLSSKDEQLKEGGTAKYKAPNGDVTVAYTGHKVGAKHTVVGTIQFDLPKVKEKTAFTVTEGHPFFHAGESYNGGILIYALTCKTAE